MACWSDERIAELEGLIAKGASAGEAAAHFGGVFSRNALIGAALRCGLHFNSRPGRRGEAKATALAAPTARPAPPVRRVPALKPPAPKPAPKPTMRPALEAPAPVAELVEGPGVPFAELAAHQCRWPSGGPAVEDFRFCGAARPGAGPYCAAHAARAYAKPRASAAGRIGRD
ncbi:GcrA cell cycle regulator [Methylocella tundrae]|uniref:GcrA cell cycle regulator n=1 Tax=Methylocella tundrae TaxID=227605 RepID=A0A8B6MC51_METTU|nr:GcrA family cell cycle regulator [Methylocella tundrae]VTZ52514.1 GcrA cell cycle regulator [Methylocella tundrae]